MRRIFSLIFFLSFSALAHPPRGVIFLAESAVVLPSMTKLTHWLDEALAREIWVFRDSRYFESFLRTDVPKRQRRNVRRLLLAAATNDWQSIQHSKRAKTSESIFIDGTDLKNQLPKRVVTMIRELQIASLNFEFLLFWQAEDAAKLLRVPLE